MVQLASLDSILRGDCTSEQILRFIESKKGVKAHARHQFIKRTGPGCSKVMLGKLDQIAAVRKITPFPWDVSADDIYKNTLRLLPELSLLDDRAAGAVVHMGKCQLNVGIPMATAVARMEAGLPDAFDDRHTVGGKTFDSLYRMSQGPLYIPPSAPAEPGGEGAP